MSNIKSIKMAEGVTLRLAPARQFKTNRISVFFYVPVKRSNVTKISLLRQVLKRGCEKYPTLTALAARLEDLYGANLSGGIRKKGDGELFYFTVEYIADRFVGENLTRKTAQLLNEVVFNPLIIDGGFSADYLNQEKNNLKSYIEGIINDKREYAQLRCVDEMFKGEPYGIFEYGYIEDFEDITPENLYEFYKEIINEARVELFVSGTFDEEAVQKEIEEIFTLKGRKCEAVDTALAVKKAEVNTVTEEMSVSQSKLCIGLSCGISYRDPHYYALVLYNTIFGGSPVSKLFNNVREKMSLAYFVFSRIDRMKGFMLISSGIETENYQRAYDEIMAQMDKMLKGDFTDAETDNSKKYLKNSFNSMKDSISAMEDFYVSQIICGGDESIDEICEKIDKVTREEIQQAGREITLDTIYFLKGREEA